ncbi:MAG: Flp pilus assembly complex ATPase component [Euryarchaeota archaeon]|nr:Flp pilus assembly complex ATPase component [Euryarchaeota archaeon]
MESHDGETAERRAKGHIYVPDTSVVVDGRFTRFIQENVVNEVIIPTAVLGEIEHQANRGLATGFSGLAELKKIREACENLGITLSFYELEPSEYDIKHAHQGAIDALIRKCAHLTGATLITGDSIQRYMAEIEGIPVIYLAQRKETNMRIEDFFDEETMSVHIKAGVSAFAKRGRPGHFEMVKIAEPLSPGEVEELAYDIIERARRDEKSFIEMDLKGATVVQLRDYRIAITRPPFSDAMEITAVHPIVKLTLEDYALSEKLRKRLDEGAEGILVAGAPGAGKSTFVQALAEHYASLNRIVKTMEKPRDLVLRDEITQYTALEGDMAKTGDILLLVRPDYTVFDEMRTTDDFKVFTDLRLAGVGMVGVVHATRAIDALQRFIGRVELGVIPQIVDTIIHITAGEVGQVLTLSYVVKVPTGMNEEDLARPVIEVRDLNSEKLLYEIYSFGEQVVVVPVQEESAGIYRLAEKKIEEELKRLYPGARVRAKVTGTRSATIYVRESSIPAIIGKGGKNIERLERMLGISLSVEPLGGATQRGKIKVEVEIRKKTIQLVVGEEYARRKVAVLAGDSELFQAVVSREGKINMRKSTSNGKKLMHAINEGITLYAVPV